MLVITPPAPSSTEKRAATGLAGHGGSRTTGHPSTTVKPLIPLALDADLPGAVGAGATVSVAVPPGDCGAGEVVWPLPGEDEVAAEQPATLSPVRRQTRIPRRMDMTL